MARGREVTQMAASGRRTASDRRTTSGRRTVSGRRTAGQEYIVGNTVRAAQPQWETEEPVRPARRRRAVSRMVRKNQEKALRMDLPCVAVLTVAVACVLCICVNYLQIQSRISARIHHIAQLEQNLEQLKAENDAEQASIKTNIDLEYVYKVATEELGMVYANKDQVLLYDKIESEYVRQYEDIPEP